MHPVDASPSKRKQIIARSKNTLFIWWDQKGMIYYEQLKSSETITGDHYGQKIDQIGRDLRKK